MSRKLEGAGGDQVSRLSGDELHKLLTYVHQEADDARRSGRIRAVVDELIVMVLAHAGLRPRELCALHIGDIPALGDRPEIRIRRGGDRTGRAIEVPEEVVHVICRYIQLYRKGAKPDDPLLLSERGTPFSYMSLHSKIRRIGKEARVSRLHPGMLRRTFLADLFEKEQDLRFVQEQAGHAHVKTTASLVRPQRPRVPCDACGRYMVASTGVTIDSGQILCPACFSDLRNH